MIRELSLSGHCIIPVGHVHTHLNFVHRLSFLQTMGPHRGGALVIGQAPALLAQTLGFEAGKRPVVRDVYRLRGHGSLPGEGRGR